MIFLRFPFQCDLKLLEFQRSVCADVVKEKIYSYLGYEEFVLLCNGKQIYDKDVIPDESTVQVAFSLPGGKGGFGSMLRAIGAQIEKTTNREACRDLSGRRLRDINEEQRLKKWIAKEAEREAEKIKRRQARIERLKSKAPHNFFDFEYEKKISELPTRINEALNEGLQKAKQPTKRPAEEPKLPKKSWLGEDFPLSSSDSDSEVTNNGSPSKKLKKDHKPSSASESDMSESSQSLAGPSTSKYNSFALDDSNSSSYNSENAFTKVKDAENDDSVEMNMMQDEEKTSDTSSDRHDVNLTARASLETKSCSEEREIEMSKSGIPGEEKNSETEMDVSQEKCAPDNIVDGSGFEQKTPEEDSASTVDSIQSTKQPETKKDDDTPIDLMEFQSVSELEGLGLDRLKSALMSRGLKCGGTLSDRAQRLWKIRGLQPHEYPAILLAKNKK